MFKSQIDDPTLTDYSIGSLQYVSIKRVHYACNPGLSFRESLMCTGIQMKLKGKSFYADEGDVKILEYIQDTTIETGY